jgi:integrase/recombinase XerD
MSDTQDPPRHAAVAAFLHHLRTSGRDGSARAYGGHLDAFERWLAGARVDLLRATTADLAGYQRHIAERQHHRTGAPLSAATRSLATIAVLVLYRWLARRGQLLCDPAAALLVPRAQRQLTVAKDHLTQQEVVALLQAQAARVEEQAAGSLPWARELRNLALVATALATGRRVHGLVTLRVADLDLERGELRVAVEKGRTGRVLPVAGWCVGVLRRYLRDARQLLAGGRESDYLFPSRRSSGLGRRGFAAVLDQVVAEAARRNPDLADLPAKRISTHSLRVSFATLLFANGCNIRSLNELMLHERLSTTALYTPIAVDDLRRELRLAHPRA